MNSDFVKDEEVLYRSIPYDKRDYYTTKEGELKISSQAFGDRSMKPSVDRADLCDNNPKYTQIDPKDGIVSLICQNVRLIDLTQKDEKGKQELYKYKIDVIPRPEYENIAHAQVEPSPEYKNKQSFRKIQERLAYLACWEIRPEEFHDI